jgi:hypothetical protein
MSIRSRIPVALALICSALWLPAGAADYKLGERLPSEATRAAPAAAYRQIDWLALVPKGWDPMAELRSLDLANLQDSDPRAVQALEKLKQLSNEAPVEPSMDGQKVRLPGFAIPLERSGRAATELLLVPYFGACIHTPPPPANQVIHVKVARAASEVETMAAVWVSGTLRVVRTDTEFGRAAYQMDADSVVLYDR